MMNDPCPMTPSSRIFFSTKISRSNDGEEIGNCDHDTSGYRRVAMPVPCALIRGHCTIRDNSLTETLLSAVNVTRTEEGDRCAEPS
jgi:hypothetical protein